MYRAVFGTVFDVRQNLVSDFRSRVSMSAYLRHHATNRAPGCRGAIYCAGRQLGDCCERGSVHFHSWPDGEKIYTTLFAVVTRLGIILRRHVMSFTSCKASSSIAWFAGEERTAGVSPHNYSFVTSTRPKNKKLMGTWQYKTTATYLCEFCSPPSRGRIAFSGIKRRRISRMQGWSRLPSISHNSTRDQHYRHE